MRVHVDDTRRDPFAAGVDHDFAALVETTADGDNLAAIHYDVRIVETLAGPGQYGSALKNRRCGRQRLVAARVGCRAVVICAWLAGRQQNGGRQRQHAESRDLHGRSGMYGTLCCYLERCGA